MYNDLLDESQSSLSDHTPPSEPLEKILSDLRTQHARTARNAQFFHKKSVEQHEELKQLMKKQKKPATLRELRQETNNVVVTTKTSAQELQQKMDDLRYQLITARRLTCATLLTTGVLSLGTLLLLVVDFQSVKSIQGNVDTLTTVMRNMTGA